jgi:hypothetical protein
MSAGRGRASIGMSFTSAATRSGRPSGTASAFTLSPTWKFLNSARVPRNDARPTRPSVSPLSSDWCISLPLQ